MQLANDDDLTLAESCLAKGFASKRSSLLSFRETYEEAMASQILQFAELVGRIRIHGTPPRAWPPLVAVYQEILTRVESLWHGSNAQDSVRDDVEFILRAKRQIIDRLCSLNRWGSRLYRPQWERLDWLRSVVDGNPEATYKRNRAQAELRWNSDVTEWETRTLEHPPRLCLHGTETGIPDTGAMMLGLDLMVRDYHCTAFSASGDLLLDQRVVAANDAIAAFNIAVERIISESRIYKWGPALRTVSLDSDDHIHMIETRVNDIAASTRREFERIIWAVEAEEQTPWDVDARALLEEMQTVSGMQPGEPDLSGDLTLLGADNTRRARRREIVSPILTKLGFATEEWAMRAGVDPKTARNYLNGLTNITNSTRRKLAEAISVDVTSLPD